VNSSLILPFGGGAPTSGALVSLRGEPIPSPEVERVLRLADPRWFLKFAPLPKPHWNVCQRWLPDDQRRRLIRDRVLAPDADFDVLCYCPPDVSADEALSYIEKRLVRVTDARQQAEREQAAIYQAQEAMRQRIRDDHRAEVIHQAKNTTPHQMRVLAGAETAHPMVHGADLT
jgi:hypothetical protein